METMHFIQGEKAAINGKFRASPNLKILSRAWKDWYRGYDSATKNGDNKNLNADFSLTNNSRKISARID